MPHKNIPIIALLLLLGGGVQAQQKASAQKVKAYLVADAHLDTQWNWDVQTTINEYVRNTIERNLALLKKYPDYIFNFEGGVKYAWMKEYYPRQYEEMKRYIKEGRWHIAGSSWEASDVLIPSVESSIRNILLGQTFYRQEFGTEGTDIFLPDCFGFGWTLPSLAAHCGLIGFSSQKLDWRTRPFYGNSKHPFTLGLWKGIDGKQVMLTHGYGYGHRWNDEDLSENKGLVELAHRTPLNTVYRYYGTGDTGGSPTIQSVRAVERGVKGNGPVEIISATSDQMYKDYLPFADHPELPVYDGELLMDVHGTGCYTSQAAMKLYNRQNEQLGDAAERAAVTAEWLGASTYPRYTLTDTWRRFIYHQFHDDLTGTSIPRAYEFSWNDELIALKQFSGVLASSVNAVASQMNTQTKGTPILLYNACAFPVNDLAEIILEMPEEPKGFAVYDERGKKVASQLIGYENGRARLLVSASLPACGYVVYDVRTTGKEKTQSSTETSTLENSVYKISLDRNGDIVSLIDKRTNKELVLNGKAIRLALFTENKSYTWPAWEIMKETIDREPISITDGTKITLVENGALRKSLCIEKTYGHSHFKQYIRLYEGSRADRIDFYNEIDWETTNALLKAEFPLSIENEKATYDLGLGSVERGNNTPTAYEVYAQQWADLTDKKGNYGVSILNDCKYGWDKPNNHTLRLSLIHTPKTRKSYAYQDRQDFGHHTFTYSIIGHVGTLDKPATVLKATVLNQPIKAFVVPKHTGVLGKSFAFVRSDSENVTVIALKKAEVTDEYVLRLFETAGKATENASITFAGQIADAVMADGTEKTTGKAYFDGSRLNVSITPYGIQTYKIRLKKREASASKPSYANLPLKYDRRCFSWNDFRHEADFESGNSYAAELLPDSVLEADGVPFRLGEKDVPNGLTCKGDTLLLPKGHSYNRIYFLAASAGNDTDAQFRVGNRRETFRVPCYTGFIGQWEHTGHTEGFLKNANIAYVGTHRHSPQRDEAYEFTYMFKFGMDIPTGATAIVLPNTPDVVLFAATLAKEPYSAVKWACEPFRTSLKAEDQSTEEEKTNLLTHAKLMKCSGETNKAEVASHITDGNLSTKWCDVNAAPNYIDFDLGKEQVVSSWKLVNAGTESRSFITRTCFLQGRNSESEEWRTIDELTDNTRNVVERRFKKTSVRYIRLLVTQSTQNNSLKAARIYELEVY